MSTIAIVLQGAFPSACPRPIKPAYTLDEYGLRERRGRRSRGVPALRRGCDAMISLLDGGPGQSPRPCNVTTDAVSSPHRNPI